MNKINKNYKRSQKGRSMVEMLGVLAIVGVLSVGGVYGYGVAMKKHKANELLHQASMLATTISAQAMTNEGVLPQTITSFGNSSYGNFSTSVTNALDGKGFTITIENMDSAVCTQMEKMTGGMVQGASCSGTTLTLTYYKNLATTEAEGKNSPTGGSSGGNTKPSTCPTGTSTDGSGAPAVTLADNSMCYCEASGTRYKDGACESKGDDDTCSSYADCDKGQYCQFKPTSCATDPTSGTCKPVSDCGMYPINIDDGHDYKASDYGGSCSPDWWTAKDVCASLNMHMVSLSEVGCEGSKDVFCPTSDTVFGALKAKGLKWAFWTTDMYDSCSAWSVASNYTVPDDAVYYSARTDKDGGFLCVR